MKDERNQTILISLICLILVIGIILIIVYYKKHYNNKPETTQKTVITKVKQIIDKYIETDNNKNINDNYIWDVEPCNKDRLKYDDKMMTDIYNYNGNEIYLF